MNIRKLVALALMISVMPALAHADSRGKNFKLNNSRSWNTQSYSHSYPSRNLYSSHSYSRNDDCYQGGSYYSNGYSYGGIGEQAIRDGIRSGRLSQREAWELRNDQRNIQREQAAYRADGRLTYRERDDLRDDINDFHKDLNHELNDGERRQPWYFGSSWLRGW